jgi:hypothetical protein
MIIFLSALCLLLTFILSFSIYFNIKHGILLLRMQDSIEKALDVLDSKYKKIGDILEIPIFFDSIEVRQAVSEIKSARDSILYIANELTGEDKSQESTDSEND